MVADVTVSGSDVTVDRVVVAIDCTVVNPDMVVQQMEGGIAFGLTSLFKDAITFTDGRVDQTNFGDYRLLTMSEMPTCRGPERSRHWPSNPEAASSSGDPRPAAVLSAILMT